MPTPCAPASAAGSGGARRSLSDCQLPGGPNSSTNQPRPDVGPLVLSADDFKKWFEPVR